MCQRWSTGQPGCYLVILQCAGECVVVLMVVCAFHSLHYDTQQDINNLKKSFQILEMAPVKGDGPNCF